MWCLAQRLLYAGDQEVGEKLTKIHKALPKKVQFLTNGIQMGKM